MTLWFRCRRLDAVEHAQPVITPDRIEIVCPAQAVGTSDAVTRVTHERPAGRELVCHEPARQRHLNVEELIVTGDSAAAANAGNAVARLHRIVSDATREGAASAASSATCPPNECPTTCSRRSPTVASTGSAIVPAARSGERPGENVEIIVRMATVDSGGPTGTLAGNDGPVPR